VKLHGFQQQNASVMPHEESLCRGKRRTELQLAAIFRNSTTARDLQLKATPFAKAICRLPQLYISDYIHVESSTS
jgi:hypothetical protein